MQAVIRNRLIPVTLLALGTWTLGCQTETMDGLSNSVQADEVLASYTYGPNHRVFPNIVGLSRADLQSARLIVPNEIITGYGPNEGTIPRRLLGPIINAATGNRIVTHVAVPDNLGNIRIACGADGWPIAVMDSYGTANGNRPMFIDRRVHFPVGSLNIGAIAPRMLLKGEVTRDESQSVQTPQLPSSRYFLDLSGRATIMYAYLRDMNTVATPLSPHRRVMWIGTAGSAPYSTSTQDYTIDFGTHQNNSQKDWKAEETVFPKGVDVMRGQLIMFDNSDYSGWLTAIAGPVGLSNYDNHIKRNIRLALENAASAIQMNQVDAAMLAAIHYLRPDKPAFSYAQSKARFDAQAANDFQTLFEEEIDYGDESSGPEVYEGVEEPSLEAPPQSSCQNGFTQQEIIDLTILGLQDYESVKDGTLPPWEEIRKAQRRWVRTHHPDFASANDKPLAEAYFKAHYENMTAAVQRLKAAIKAKKTRTAAT